LPYLRSRSVRTRHRGATTPGEFAYDQAELLRNAGFDVFLSANDRPHAAAFVATALRRGSFRMPPIEVTTVPLELPLGSKTLLLVHAVHHASGRPLVLANAHVPWCRNAVEFEPVFRLIVRTVLGAPSAAHAVLCGDFNTTHESFAAALPADPPRIINVIPDVAFSSLGPSNRASAIDHMWYVSRKEPAAAGEEGGGHGCPPLMRAPTSSIVVPNSPDELVRHADATNADGTLKPAYQSYFSDHATVAADCLLSHSMEGPQPGDLLRAAQEAERQLGRANPVALTMQRPAAS